MNWRWAIKFALKDGKQEIGKLLLFTSSIIIGVAALVAITSFKTSLQDKINSDAKELLGADFRASKYAPFVIKELDEFRKIAVDSATEKSFVSMAVFKGGEASRLVSVRSISGKFPFYGEIKTEPKEAISSYLINNTVLADQALFMQFNLQVGDSILLGTQKYALAGQIIDVSGQSGISSAFAPSVIVPESVIKKSNLIQPGSRVLYNAYFKINNESILQETLIKNEKYLNDKGFRFETVEERKKRIGKAFGNLTAFMNLVGLVALILGSIGVASAVFTYIKFKIKDIGVLRSIGASKAEVFSAYLIQVVVITLFGSLIGAALGAFLQYFLPQILQDFLPVEVQFSFQPFSVLVGLSVGVIISLLFASLPLLWVRNTSPMVTLNGFLEQTGKFSDKALIINLLLIFLVLGGFAFLQTQSLLTASVFLISIAIIVFVLWGVAFLLRFLAKKMVGYLPVFTLKQGISNLFRPNNFSTILITVTGLGVALINIIFLLQSNILGQLSFTQASNQPNTILFDIQPNQLLEVEKFIENQNIPIIQKVPIVAMRLHSLNKKSRFELTQDSALGIPGHVPNREYRATYRDTLISSEKIIKGKWIGTAKDNQVVPISISENLFEDMKASIGDTLEFNISGVILPCYIASVREVDFTRIQTNFTVVFPQEVLEDAPKNFVIVSRVNSKEQSLAFQNNIVNTFPNISVIDINQILKTANEVLNKISFVISFLAFLCLLTGLLVLISAISNTRFERINEGVLLKTLGAVNRKIVFINTIEYLIIGLFSVISGGFISVVAAYFVSNFGFNIEFKISFFYLTIISLSVILLITLLGYIYTLSIAKKSALNVLRTA